MPSKMKNLSGQNFGAWIVLGLNDRRGKHTYWKCICECGTEKVISSTSLLSEKSKSCGCHQFKYSIVGEKFGRLMVVRVSARKTSSGQSKYDCQCDCGKAINVMGFNLRNGITQSCGCLNTEQKVYRIDTLRFEGTNVGKIRSNNLYSNNSSGVRGVTWDKQCSAWRARIRFKGKSYMLGRHKNLSDAATIRKQAEEKIFGEFLEWYDSQFSKKPNATPTASNNCL